MAVAGEQVKLVQIDGLVVLKIIKHCEEEGAVGAVVQGVLLGLVVDDKLEITNCFPFPRHGMDEDFDEVQYQMEMMRSLRHVNIDHLHVGWYQSTVHGAFLNRALLDSQFSYQNEIEESVVLVYDPQRTAGGSLCLRAFRLSPMAMEAYKEGEFTSESFKKHSLGYENLFEEISVVIKNSNLINVLCCELIEKAPRTQESDFLSLAASGSLSRQLHCLMDCVDDLNQETTKFNNYQRNLAKQAQAKNQYAQKRQLENAARQAKGEPPLPEEDVTKIFKPITPPPRLDALLLSGQLASYCKQITDYSAHSFGKVFMAKALQEDTQGSAAQPPSL
ncbi:eukaryotic translation initiation factor 3 subunit H-B-like [Branchiostoma lanceolatum]|uniref:eukaryotic translation initiation factor 3 subunit H-B-like n=1 Tax=Branchiostoma lanceolatum TaxID=7740 RepID=UPI0011331A22